ncbi:MAG: 30S ribosomal protein S2 [Myxococcales bacterium]|nr:30S ribosomal protein S2 [Myxococcales bacterium]
MAAVTIRELLEAGVHFGHQTGRWNPKMRPFIYGARNGIHIIDLQKTVPMFDAAFNYISAMVARGESVLFVGTKKQAQETVRTHALRCGMYHVTHRWLGGTLTNFRTIKGSIDRLRTIDRMLTDGTSDHLTKKETLKLFREREKLEANLGGIKSMEHLPGAVFVIDTLKEHIAVAEARKLGIKVVAVVDTNSDPDNIDFPIPGNDDAIRAIELFTSRVADAVLAGKRSHNERFSAGNEKPSAAEMGAGSYEGGPEVAIKPAGMEMPAPEASASPEQAAEEASEEA